MTVVEVTLRYAQPFMLLGARSGLPTVIHGEVGANPSQRIMILLGNSPQSLDRQQCLNQKDQKFLRAFFKKRCLLT
jgi:hypothetical protein